MRREYSGRLLDDLILIELVLRASTLSPVSVPIVIRVELFLTTHHRVLLVNFNLFVAVRAPVRRGRAHLVHILNHYVVGGTTVHPG